MPPLSRMAGLRVRSGRPMAPVMARPSAFSWMKSSVVGAVDGEVADGAVVGAVADGALDVAVADGAAVDAAVDEEVDGAVDREVADSPEFWVARKWAMAS